MKNKYLMVAMLTLGLSSVAGAVGCNVDSDCEDINCPLRVSGITLSLKNKGAPVDAIDVKADDTAICKNVGGAAHGDHLHCTCMVNINIQ
jgi:hypothetical protein